MKIRRLVPTLAAAAAALGWVMPTPVAPQDFDGYPVEARVWLDRGDEPVLRRGDAVRIYYRVSESAFAAIFHIDTNGNVRMIFPSSPQENHYAVGGRDYRVLFPGSSYWNVDDDPGVGYFFIVASPTPFDFRSFGYSHFAGGWDLSMVGRQVYGDPYLAMDDYVAALIPDWEYVGYGLDFTSYNVDRHYDYPRFLCYDCHGFQPYYSWNPYHYTCTDFRVVIYSDPYYYPVTRYRGTRVVYVQPRVGVPRFTFKERGRGEAGTPQVVVRTNPPPSQPGIDGAETRRAVPRNGSALTGGSGRSAGSQPPTGGGAGTPGVAGPVTRRSGGSTPPTVTPATGRPSGVLPGQTRPVTAPPSTGPTVTRGGATARPTTGASGATPPAGSGTTGRPVLERRPTSGGSTGTGTSAPPRATPPTRPSSRVIKPGGGGGTNGTGVTSGSATRPTGSGSMTTTRPTVRSTGSSGSVSRPPVRSTGSSGSVSRPPVRSTGSSGSVSRPPARSTGSSGSVSRPPVRSSGSSAAKPRAQAAKPPPARTVKPPPPRKPRGGGGGG